VYVCERELWEQISMVIALIIRKCFVVIDLSISRRFQVSFELRMPVMWQNATVHIMHSDFNCFTAEFQGNSGAFFIKMALFGESGNGFSFISALWKVGNDKIKYERKSWPRARLTPERWRHSISITDREGSLAGDKAAGP
jgi:hypothetical protein